MTIADHFAMVRSLFMIKFLIRYFFDRKDRGQRVRKREQHTYRPTMQPDKGLTVVLGRDKKVKVTVTY